MSFRIIRASESLSEAPPASDAEAVPASLPKYIFPC